MSEKCILTNSYIETEGFASEFAKSIKPGSVIAMNGDLGAGKTCFVRGFAKGMGYDGDVNSPTFAIVNVYVGGRLDVYHFDMYRVTNWDDLYSTGYFEYLEADGVLVIEWSENIEAALPDNTIKITIDKTSDNGRKITINNGEKL